MAEELNIEVPTTAPAEVPVPVDTGTPPPTAPTSATPIDVPDLDITPTTQPYEPPTAPVFTARDIPEEQTVSGRLSKLFDDKNPYSLASQGKQAGMEYAASRGMQNTLMAGTAGIKGIMDRAVPVATSDAQIFAQAGQSAQDATQTAGLEGYRGEISASLSTLDHNQGIDVERIAQALTGTREDKAKFSQLMIGIQQKYQEDYTLIQRTPDSEMDATAKNAAINALNTSTQSQIEALSTIYNVDVSWSDGITQVAAAPPPVAPPTQFIPGTTGGAPGGTTGTGGTGSGIGTYDHITFLQRSGLQDTESSRNIYAITKYYDSPEFKAEYEKRLAADPSKGKTTTAAWVKEQTKPLYNALVQAGLMDRGNSWILKTTGVATGQYLYGMRANTTASAVDNLMRLIGKETGPISSNGGGDGDGSFGVGGEDFGDDEGGYAGDSVG